MKAKKSQKVEQPIITQEDKQNDPFIRAIAKKIRNLNKKLLDIETLEKRDDLKPEQQQKISSKQSILDERKRYEEFTKFYKTTLAESAHDKEQKQISPIIGKIANSLILAHHLTSGAEIKDIQLSQQQRKVILNIASVGKEEATIRDLGNQLGGYFNQYLENEKLISKVEGLFSNENTGNLKVNLYKHSSVENKQQPASIKQTPKKQPRQQPKQTSKVEVIPTQVETIKSAKKDSIHEQPKIEEAPKQTVQPTQTQETQKIQQVIPNVVEGETKTQENPPATTQQEGEVQDRPKRQYRDNNRPYRPRGEGQGEYRGGQGGYNRRGGYKPRYNERKEKQENEDEQSGEQDDEYVRKNFNNKQRRELQNDGFVIVQKKQKPKDAKESESNYRKTHGFKDKRPHAHHN